MHQANLISLKILNSVISKVSGPTFTIPIIKKRRDQLDLSNMANLILKEPNSMLLILIQTTSNSFLLVKTSNIQVSTVNSLKSNSNSTRELSLMIWTDSKLKSRLLNLILQLFGINWLPPRLLIKLKN